MFVVLSNLAFEASNEETDFQILKDLIDLASEAAARCIKGRWYNCGYYSNLPWITTLCSLAQRSPSTYAVACAEEVIG